ncbi:MAG: LUD domain-containing protein, partial [Isosphaeraceae bacterium]
MFERSGPRNCHRPSPTPVRRGARSGWWCRPTLPDGWAPSGVTLLREPGLTNDVLEHSDGVLTAAALGIAQTGTIVLDSGPGQGRRAITLLPDYHLCVIRDDQVVGLVPEAVAGLHTAAGDT